MKNKTLIIISIFLFFTLSIVIYILFCVTAHTESIDNFPHKIISTTLYTEKSSLSPRRTSSIYFLPCKKIKASTSDNSNICKGKNGENITQYDSEDLFWLSRIIYSESGAEPLEGKLAVGSVVMNRVASEKYPNTVYEVIFDTKFGVQFTPAATGSVYKTPDSESILAAKMCLGGYSVSDDILFFLNESIATGTWMQDNRNFVMSIGNHDFYS